MWVLGYKLGSKFHCGKAGNPHRGDAFFITGGEEQPKVQHRCMEQYGALPIVSQIVEYHSE